MNTHSDSHQLLADAFSAAITTHVAATGKLCLAFSGGMDSTVLLHVAARSEERPLRAVYIDHGLQAESADWGKHCAGVCSDLGVPFKTLRAVVDTASGEGLEAAARRARYALLADDLQPGEVLLTAHHEQDQLETFLLQTLRGGVRGLAAMREYSNTDGLPHLRPLLTVPDALMRTFAEESGLEWLEDPSNAEHRYDRNFLRHEVLPRMLDRWPAAASSVSRSARLIGESAELLDELARLDLGEVAGTRQIPIAVLMALPGIRQKNAVRYAIRACGLATPTERQLKEALEGLLASRPDSQPVASWPGVRIRRYRGVLWMFAEHDDPLEAVAHAPGSLNWQNPAQPLQLGKVRGVLELREKPGEGISTRLTEASLEIRFREGGERLRPNSGGSVRTLKNLLQESDVLPWMRSNIPLLYSSGQLLAVGDIWINAEFAAQPNETGRVLLWHDHAPVFHESALSGDDLSGKL